ncbi:hypothetical protein HYALB_00006514 [Hymenoscyphus albidus]|uniref:Uncharacterized protein n=1 Tax=Hymenoscyphus albidus TaxID=595503 RepID=A0A9N9LMQ6_9HELO|nr:hypothetical protein HYALB_00006514 [Hymenoscyphus albidus]
MSCPGARALAPRPQLVDYNHSPPGPSHHRPLNLRFLSSQECVPDQGKVVLVPFGAPGSSTSQEVKTLVLRFATDALLAQGWSGNHLVLPRQAQLCYPSGLWVSITDWEGDEVSPALENLIAQGGCVTFDVMVGRNSILREDGAVGPAFASPATGTLAPGAIRVVAGASP